MFKRKKKKTGVQTPELRKYTPPPTLPTSGSNAVKPNPNYISPVSVVKPKEERRYIRTIRRLLVDTQDGFRLIASNPSYDDILKIENADVYWSNKNGAVVVVTTQEWKDYLLGKSDAPIVEKEKHK